MAHGGMLSEARRLFADAPQPFVDLSTGINPVPYPLRPYPATTFTRLPDADDEASLRRVAAAAYGVSDPGMIAAAPGTQILISLLPTLLAGTVRPRASVAILSPTYGEHEASWRHAGHPVRAAARFGDLADADIAVLCNPNNPDGCRTPPEALRSLADRLAARGGMVIVDEAFADLEPPGLSMAAHLPHPAVIVLRSFGKYTGLAGLRLGFALAAPALAGRIRAALGPWAVSGPALQAGLQAMADTEWRDAASARLAQDGARLDRLVPMTLAGGTRLFRLYESDVAAAIHARLGAAGILVRRFAGHPRRLRFGLPADDAAWRRLEAAFQP